MLKYVFISLMAILISNASYANTVAVSPKSTATLASSCQIAAGVIPFGLFNPQLTGNNDTTGTIVTTCSKGVAYSLEMNNFYRSTCGRHEMYLNGSDTNNFIVYQMYTDSSRSTIWTNSYTVYGCTGIGNFYHLTGTGSAQSTTIYARAALNQFVTPGGYSDSITVILNF